MNNKFNWDKVNSKKRTQDKGTYSIKGEEQHNENLDKFWKKKLKGKSAQKFFEKWEKEIRSEN